MASPPRAVLQGYVDEAAAAARAGQTYTLPVQLTTRSKARFEAGLAQALRMSARSPARAPASRIPERFVNMFRSRRASSPRGVGMRARSLKRKRSRR